MKLLIKLFFSPLILLIMYDRGIPEQFTHLGNAHAPLFSFGMIADIQYSDINPVGTRFYRSSLIKLSEAVSKLNEDSVDFIINLGDLIDSGFDSYKPVLKIIDSCGTKFYHITGNHDYNVDSSLKNELPVLTSFKTGYYSFSCNKFRFIFLNGNDISLYTAGNKSTVLKALYLISELRKAGEINAMDWNGGIGNAQLHWLSDQIDEASRLKEKVFIFCHFPLLPYNAHNLLNYKEVLQILENHDNICVWFNGHNHSY